MGIQKRQAVNALRDLTANWKWVSRSERCGIIRNAKLVSSLMRSSGKKKNSGHIATELTDGNI